MCTVMNSPGRTSEWLETQLTELQRILTEMGPGFSGLALRTDELDSRLKEECFRLAVLGQFKRGKSSLLNAFLGEALLPTGILPLTAIPTTLRYGPERRVRVSWLGGRCEDYTGNTEILHQILMRYVTERENSDNHLGVMQVDVEYPSPLLAKGLEIIDTPGIGSTIPQNTQAARAVVPVCDGALFILSPDPAITEQELEFLRLVKESVTRMLVVMTKSDQLGPQDRHEVLGFHRHILHGQAGFSEGDRIFLVSARQALEARTTGQEALWSHSGMETLENHLIEFLRIEKQAALREALMSKAARLIRETLFSLDMQRKVIQLPKQELQRRSEQFEAHLAKIDQEHLYFADRLAGDLRRILEELDEQADALGGKAREELTASVKQARGEMGNDAIALSGMNQIGSALTEAVDRVFSRAAKDMCTTVTTRFRSTQDIHYRDMESLIDRVRRTAADLFEVPCLEGVTLDRVNLIREPRLFHHRWVTSFREEAASWVTRLLPHRLRLKQFDRRLEEDIEYLVARNVEELRWTVRQNIEEAFRLFRSRMEIQLHETITSIRTSLRTALERQWQRESASDPELQRLSAYEQRLIQLLITLSPTDGSHSYGSPV